MFDNKYANSMSWSGLKNTNFAISSHKKDQKNFNDAFL